MIVSSLVNECLTGEVSWSGSSYIVRVGFLSADGRKPGRIIYIHSFGNGVTAEDKLMELIEWPALTILKYG